MPIASVTQLRSVRVCRSSGSLNQADPTRLMFQVNSLL